MKRSWLPWVSLAFLLGALSCLVLAHPPAAPGHPDAASPEKGNDQLIRELGSDRFEVREAATRALTEREETTPALRKLLGSPDLEVRRRVADILAAHKTKRARRGLARVPTLAREGRVDEMVERLVLWRDWDKGEEGWKAVTELALRLAQQEKRVYGKMNFEGLFGRDPLKKLAEIWQAPPKRLRGENITLKPHETGMLGIFIIASENVRTGIHLASVILAGGDVELKGANHSIIVCAGDFKATSQMVNCLVIAHGKVICPPTVSGCVILSENTVESPNGAKVSGSVMSDGLSNSNSFVKFFNPEDLGIPIYRRYHRGDNVPAAVWIGNILQVPPPAAGLRVGDGITAVDGTKTPSEAVFDKVLRRAVARGGPIITLTVYRSGKTLEVPFPVKD